MTTVTPPQIAFQLDKTLIDLTQHVNVKFPYARFYEAVAYPGPEGGMTDLCIRAVETFFWHVRNTTVKILWMDGRHNDPVHVEETLWTNRCTIQLPLRKKLPDALQSLRNAGYDGPYAKISLYHPRDPGAMEPRYVFTLPGPIDICIGANSGEVLS